ncbi:hypothetical protein H0X48_03075 [Candidatus Dependentiae bacterium]|nr:hypothetical protein [Candidatus Dependentiae bacterium]
MTNFTKSIIFTALLLTLSNSFSSLASLKDRAADKTIEALLSQTSQEKLSASISSMPGEIQQRLKGKILEKYKDALNKALAIQFKEFKGHTDIVNSVSFSPCGKLALTGSSDKTVRLWHLATGTTIQELKGHNSFVRSVVFSPCGKYALTRSADKIACLWDVSTGSAIKDLKGHTDDMISVAFSPCGNFALTGSHDKTARLWFLPQLNTLSFEQLLFALRSQEQNINIDDVGTQNLLNSLSSTLDPYGTLPGKDYATNPLIKAYIDFRRRQLFHAAVSDDVDTVKALIKKGFNTVFTIDKAGNNLWHYAFKGCIKDGITCPSKKVLAYLLELEGADKGLKKPNKQGLPPFAVGLIYNKEFTAEFINNLTKP